MKTKIFTLKLMLAGMAVCALSCKKGATIGAQPDGIADGKFTNITSKFSVADHVIETGMTLTQINAVIAGASAGQTVYVQPGTYTITGKIVMKAGVKIVKQTTTNPIFDATGLSNILTLSYSTELNNCMFSGITFWNIRMVVTGATSTWVKYCIFDYAKRAASTNKTNNLKDDYVEFLSTDSSLVSNCVFSHRSTDPGRGVWVKSTTNAKILNNTFGNGSTTGYFVCGINDNSQTNSLIDNNVLNRNTALNSVDSLTDHGIYAHSFNGLTITNNTISGWPATGSGGAVKVRNGQNATISTNTMNGSGVLLYEYDNIPAFPYLKYVVVSGNNINMSATGNDAYHGIGYYRDNTTDMEYSILIQNNLIPNGTIWINGANLSTANFNASGGGVYNNDTASGNLYLKSGIANSGNY
ncbi:MAG: right-handed parallel beta-helix repeat-containing protein [Mucilaginibacter sp.]|uniref:right-handed parallel beta-helix repeat-containing protein n=1 Tax=Mucilaginibacter sp. TaxID=1882438 RepID=UPI003265C4D0